MPGTEADSLVAGERLASALRSATAAGVVVVIQMTVLGIGIGTSLAEIVASIAHVLVSVGSVAAAIGWFLAPCYVRQRASSDASMLLGIAHALITWVGTALFWGVGCGVFARDLEVVPLVAISLVFGSSIMGGIVTVPLGGLLLGLWQRKALSASRWT